MSDPAAPQLPAYPIVGLHFRAQLLDPASPGGGSSGTGPEYAAFQEATGLSAKMETESYREGGVNGFDHRLPTGVKYEPLKLTRGLMASEHPFAQWVRDTLQNNFAEPVVPKSVLLELLDIQIEDGEASERILRSWQFHRAWPLHWEVSGLNAMEGKLVVETLELGYDFLEQR